jgi:chaperonin cofactor prefoldin
MEEIDETLELWKNTGLLENMPPERQSELSKRLEELANYLVSLKKRHESDAIIFPVLCRIYRQVMLPVGKFAFAVDTSELIQELRDKWERFPWSDLNFSGNIDAEAEFCATFSEDYVNEIKKNR